MRKRTKARLLHRLGAWALALCLVAGLLPGTAFAAETDTGKAIQLVDSGTAANISGGQADNIYFGTYQQSSNGSGGYNDDPIKWRVLANADGKLFLLSDQNLDVKPYNSRYTSITWEKSTIRSWLNGYAASENNSGTDYSSDNFIDAAFSSDEQTAIADTYVYNKTQSNGTSNPNPSYSTSGGNDTTDQIFLLSIEEARSGSYFPNESDSRKATNTAYVASYSGMSGAGAADHWWLRSPGISDLNAVRVYDGGGVFIMGDQVDTTYRAVRPAFNLNLNAVLFTSAATGGKSASGMDSGLAEVAPYDGNEWKLTLKDSSRNGFSASTTSATTQTQGYSGWTVDVTYSGAQTGDNEYVSAMLVDGSGSVLCYGRVAQNSASGEASITIPDGLAAGDYTLKVFSEQYNGDKMTDYASACQDIALTVTEAGPDTPEPPTNPFAVTKSGGGTAVEGTDYTWDGTVLTLLTDGLTLATPDYSAASPAAARIVLPSGTYQVTLNGVHLSSDESNQNTITFNSGAPNQNALILQGQNSIASTAAATKGVLAFGNLTIKSQSGQSGSLDLSGNSGVWSDGALTVENAEVTADTTRACLDSSNDKLTIKNAAVRAESDHDALAAKEAVTIEGSVVTAAALGSYYGITCNGGISVSSGSFVCCSRDNNGPAQDMPRVTSSILLYKGTPDRGGIFDANGDRTASGASFTLTKDAEIPAGYTLLVRADQTLTIDSGVTLSGAGTVDYSADGAVFNRGGEYGSCTVTNLIGPGGTDTPTPAVTNVTVSPARVTVKKGETQQFTATVTGEEGCDQTVTWITEYSTSSGTTISTDGLLTVAADETASAFYVAAVSKADDEIYGVAFVVVDPHPHDFEKVVRESALKSPATCTEAAVYYYSCYLCGELDKSQEFTPSTGGPLGHDYGDWVCDAENHWKECSHCGDKSEIAEHIYNTGVNVCVFCDWDKSAGHVHQMTEHPATSATCTEDGNKQHYTCSLCGGKAFWDPYGTNPVKSWETVVIPATGHTGEWENNENQHWRTCGTCGTREEGAHQFEDGTCTVCGYSDPDRHVHSYGEPEFTWAEDYSSVTATFTCARGDDTQTVNCGVNAITSAPTCTNAGGTVYTATVVFDGTTYTDTKIVPGDPATGHSFGTWEHDENQHWCTCEDCGTRTGEGAHQFVDGICSICRYESTTEPGPGPGPEPGHTHTYGAYQSDASGHWQECTDPDCPDADKGKTETTAHVYDSDTDTTCNVCGYERTLAPVTYTLTVDLNGGSGSTAGGSYAPGAVISIDAGTRTSYRFAGWTTSNGGLFADPYSAGTTFTMPAADTTITANWLYTGGIPVIPSVPGGGSGSSSSATYVPSVDAGRNGDVTVSPSRPSSGQTVTITVDPDKGYELDDLTVTDARGNVVKVTDNGDGTYSFTQPSSKVTIEATFAEIQEEPALAFTDVTERDYYYDAVLWALENGITSGTTAATFSPDDVCTRAQAVTFLWRAAGSPAPESGEMPFTDVAAGAYYYDAVLWAVENGITRGTSATTFSPDVRCTRAHIVTFLWRSQGCPVPGSGEMPFTDVAAGAYYYDAVLWAVENHITSGTTAATFSPDVNCTRAQIVTFLWRSAQ